MAAYRLRPEVMARDKARRATPAYKAYQKQRNQSEAQKAKKAEIRRRDSTHDRRVQRVYGLAPGQYAEMLEAQGGVCLLCGNRPRTIRLAVDHDHQTGRIRGLLCRRCNKALGFWEHDELNMLNLIRYVEDIIANRK